MTNVISVLFAIALSHFIIANLFAIALLVVALVSLRGRRFRASQLAAPGAASSPLTLPLSVVVPAYNEEDAVVNSVHAILNSAIPDMEVIVVDDGSTDRTVERLIAAFDMVPFTPSNREPIVATRPDAVLRSRTQSDLFLVIKKNGGKADALNAGINMSRYRYVLLTDADCVFEPGSLLAAMMVIGFDPGAHVGVGGTVRVRNGMEIEEGRIVTRRLPQSLLGKFQVVEYMGAMTGNRAGWDALNGVPTLSGAFAIWRRDVLIELGGMTKETTHEDIEFTLRAHEHFRRTGQRYRIITLADAVVWTEAPHRWRDLYRQRKRWQRVVLECVWRYRRMILNPRYGEVGTVTMPYLLLFEALGPLVEVGTIGLVVFMYAVGQLLAVHVVLFLLFSAALVALTRIISVIGDAWLYRRFPPGAILRLAAVALLEGVFYRPVILISRLMAFPEFLRGRKTWERALREQPKVANA